MNLSARLDAARRQREQGKAKPLEPHPLDLRYTVEGQAYDGHELRTGEELTPERWEERLRRDQALPPWKPRGGVGPARGEGEPVIDLTQPPPEPPPPPGTAIELPPWARQDEERIPTTPDLRPAPDEGACVNCGGEPRVDVLDMVSGVAHLECTSCGFTWQASTHHRSWPGRSAS